MFNDRKKIPSLLVRVLIFIYCSSGIYGSTRNKFELGYLCVANVEARHEEA